MLRRFNELRFDPARAFALVAALAFALLAAPLHFEHRLAQLDASAGICASAETGGASLPGVPMDGDRSLCAVACQAVFDGLETATTSTGGWIARRQVAADDMRSAGGAAPRPYALTATGPRGPPARA